MQTTQQVMGGFLKRTASLFPVLIALLCALLVTSILLISLRVNPLVAFSAIYEGAFSTENAVAETLVKATPILFVAIGITIAFKAGVINIGGEGQMIVGAIAGTAATLAVDDVLGWLAIPVALLVAFFAGGLYGALAGALKAYFGVNEILSTIMLNQVAVQLMNYLLNGVMLDPESAGFNNIPKTARIAAAAQIPRLEMFALFDRTRLHYGLIIAIVLAVLAFVLLRYTTVGFRIRTVGNNEKAARYAGMNVGRVMVLSMFLSGGLSGLAGIVQVLGLQYRLQTDGSPAGFTASAGFNGIVAALFGGLNPLGAIPASTLFGGLLVGAQKMQREVGVPASLVTVMNGMVVVFVVSSQIFIQRRLQRVRLQEMAAEAEAEQARSQSGGTLSEGAKDGS